MINIFDAARTNAEPIRRAFDEMLLRSTEAKAELIRQFATWVESETLISINTKLYVVTDLINGGNYHNTYEWAQEQSLLSGRPLEELLNERLGPHYEGRVAFDHEFENGENFRYGALNAGGSGLTYFDPYCLVLTREFQLSLHDSACLPGDSLKLCFLTDGSLDFFRIADRIAPVDHSHLLVATERASEITGLNTAEWPVLIISSNRYFEVIFIGEITLASVGSVRVSKSEYDAKWDLTFLNLGADRKEAERALVHDFFQLRRAEVQGRVKVEVLS